MPSYMHKQLISLLLQILIKANLDHRMKLNLVKVLVDRGAKIDTPDSSGLTPFATAVSNGEKVIADFLHAKGAPKRVPEHMYPQFYSMYLQLPMN
jgi:ankyrin repeat protein